MPGPWRIFLANSSAPGTALEELDKASSRQFQFGLNLPGEVNFSLPLIDVKSNELAVLTKCISLYRGEDFVWSGPIWTLDESAPDDTLQVKSVGWFENLNHRFMRLGYANASTPSFVNPSAASNTTGWYAYQYGVSRNTGTYQSSPASFLTGGLDFIATGFNSVTFEPTHSYLVKGYIRRGGAAQTDFKVGFGAFDALPGGFADKAVFSGDYAAITLPTTFGVGTFDQFSIEWTPSQSYSTSGLASFAEAIGGSKVSLMFTPDNATIYIDTLTISTTKLTQLQQTYTNIDAGAIVDAILDDINADVSSGIATGTIQTSANRSRTYKRYANVGQAIQELVSVENGFDFTINPSTKVMDIHYKAGPPSGYGNNRTNVVFGYRAGPNNLQSISRRIDGDKLANYVVVQGKYGSVLDSDSTSITAYGAREELVALGDVPDINVLAAYAGVEVLGRKDPRNIYNFVPRPRTDPNDTSVPSLYDDYWIGDIVYLNAKHGRMEIDQQAVRIFGLSVSVDDAGTERIDNIQTSLE